MGLGAGQLDQRVTFYRVSTSSNTQGGRTLGTPTAILTSVPAEVTGSSGDEGPRAGQQTAVGDYTVRVRYSTTAATITPKDYLVWGSKTLQIQSARPDGHRLRESVVFTCVERTS